MEDVDDRGLVKLPNGEVLRCCLFFLDETAGSSGESISGEDALPSLRLVTSLKKKIKF